MKKSIIIIFCILGFFAMIFLANELEIFGVKFWGVRKENARREVFEQTQSYVEGKRQDLIKYHHEWINADADSKKSIEATIRMEFANFDDKKITDLELQSFLTNIKNN